MTAKTIVLNASDFDQNYGFGDGHDQYFLDLAPKTNSNILSDIIDGVHGLSFKDKDGNIVKADRYSSVIVPPFCVYYTDEDGTRHYTDKSNDPFVVGVCQDRCSSFVSVATLLENEFYIYEKETDLYWHDESPDEYDSWVGYSKTENRNYVITNDRLCWIDEAGNLREDNGTLHDLQIKYLDYSDDPGFCGFIKNDGTQWYPLTGYYVENPSDGKNVFISHDFDGDGVVYFSEETAGFDPEGNNVKTNSCGRIAAAWNDAEGAFIIRTHGGKRYGSCCVPQEKRAKVSYTIPASIDKMIRDESEQNNVSSSEIVSSILKNHYNQ